MKEIWLGRQKKGAKWHFCRIEIPEEIENEAQIISEWMLYLPRHIHPLPTLCGCMVGVQWLSRRALDDDGRPLMPLASICLNCRRLLEAEAAKLREVAEQYKQLRPVYEFWREQGVVG